MRNLLTLQIESYFGTFIVLLVSILAGITVYQAYADFDSELEVLQTRQAEFQLKY